MPTTRYMGSLSEANIETIAKAQAVLGPKGVPGLDPAALGGNLFWRPPANTSVLKVCVCVCVLSFLRDDILSFSRDETDCC